jgi:Na+-transporting NADH:ubiquinone oxidoreductase subunit B
MKGIEKIVNRIKPVFSKGGKLGFLHSTFDAFESFLLVPATVTGKGSHIRDCNDLKRVMIVVVIALVPCLLFGMYNTGLQHYLAMGPGAELPGFFQIFWYGFLRVIPLVIVSYVVGLGIEFTVAQVRGHEVNEGYLVTGMLIPLIVPVTIPLWMLATAVAFSVLIGKEIFGGTGMNIWNPALLARAFLFFSYPGYMTGDKVWIDGFSGATPLALWTEQAGAAQTMPSWRDMFLGFIPGSVGETSVVCIMLGAAILIYTGVASWKIMVSCLAGASLTGLLGGIPVHYHLVMGGFAFGCVFMATDPVTSPQTEAGKWFYGALIGILTVIIRLFNPGYPEGMMLAILLMNTFAPLIDHYVVAVHVKRKMKRIAANG